jgi:hypothetical protein
MAPRHDEIVKHLDDGFAIAWDTTRTDAERVKEVRKVVKERSAQLGEIFGTADIVVTSGNKTIMIEAKSSASPTAKGRRRSRAGNAR